MKPFLLGETASTLETMHVETTKLALGGNKQRLCRGARDGTVPAMGFLATVTLPCSSLLCRHRAGRRYNRPGSRPPQPRSSPRRSCRPRWSCLRAAPCRRTSSPYWQPSAVRPPAHRQPPELAPQTATRLPVRHQPCELAPPAARTSSPVATRSFTPPRAPTCSLTGHRSFTPCALALPAATRSPAAFNCASSPRR
jgi:hypothetical protein